MNGAEMRSPPKKATFVATMNEPAGLRLMISMDPFACCGPSSSFCATTVRTWWSLIVTGTICSWT